MFSQLKFPTIRHAAVLLAGFTPLILNLATPIGVCGAEPGQTALRKALVFHASFDHGAKADFGGGDRELYWAPKMVKDEGAKLGLPESGFVTIVHGAGRYGDALRFHRKSPEMVFFRAAGNMPYATENWSGSVSFWLKVDPERELEPGYTDPIQITPRAWNDAAFFVEFTQDEKPRHFRLGAYADIKVWNPLNRDWGAIPFNEKPLVAVPRPDFRADKWTHVLFTFERFNTHRKDGVAKLYLDGKLMGAMPEREQTYGWDPAKTMIMLGLSFVGFWDDLAIFNRALSADEVGIVRSLERGAASLHP
jgi:hypothetical protein